MPAIRTLLQWLRHKLRPDQRADLNDVGLELTPHDHIRDHPHSTLDVHWHLPDNCHRRHEGRRPRGKRGR